MLTARSAGRGNRGLFGTAVAIVSANARFDPYRHVYAYFNNDLQGHAVRDALTLREMLGASVR